MATLTIAFSSPGRTLSTVGPLRLDMFWVSLAVSVTLILSVLVLGEYNPEEYGLEPEKARK